MRTVLVAIVVFGMMGLCGCSKGGMESQSCKDYFAAVEQCAAKAPTVKAEAYRKTAQVSKENFAKNLNPMAVEMSCKSMLESLQADPDCKK